MKYQRWGGRRGRNNWRERESRIGKYGGKDTGMNRRKRDDQTYILHIRYNVAHNPIRPVPNAPLASAPSKEFHHPIFILLEMHGGQVEIYRDRKILHI